MKTASIMKLSCLILTFIFSMNVKAGLNITDLMIENVGSNSQIQLINNHLVYKDDNGFLWSYSNTTNTGVQISINESPVKLNKMVSNNNLVYLLNKTDGHSVYIFDGVNIEKLMDGYFESIDKSVDGSVVAFNQDLNSIYLLDSSEAEIYTLGDLSFEIGSSNFCKMAAGKAIVKSSSGLFFINNDSSTPIDLGNESGSSSSPSIFLSGLESCLVGYFDYTEDTYKYFNINSGGIIEAISVGNEKSLKLKNFSNEILAKSSKSILELQDSEFISVFEVSSYNESIVDYWAGEDFLYVMIYFDPCQPGPCVPPPFPDSNQIIVLNSDYQEVSRFTLNGNFTPQVLFIASESDYFFSNNKAHEFISINNGQVKSKINNPKVSPYEFIGGFSGGVYMLASSSLGTGFRVIKLSESASVSHQLNGLWYDPELKHQGLSIHTGTRTDGSKYLFTSFYVFKDGQPFWLAGNVDMVSGSESITIPLFEYTGSSYLPNDVGTDEQKIPYGAITIKPETCNSISVQTDFNDNDSEPLQLQRIVNIANNNWCTE